MQSCRANAQDSAMHPAQPRLTTQSPMGGGSGPTVAASRCQQPECPAADLRGSLSDRRAPDDSDCQNGVLRVPRIMIVRSGLTGVFRMTRIVRPACSGRLGLSDRRAPDGSDCQTGVLRMTRIVRLGLTGVLRKTRIVRLGRGRPNSRRARQGGERPAGVLRIASYTDCQLHSDLRNAVSAS